MESAERYTRESVTGTIGGSRRCMRQTDGFTPPIFRKVGINTDDDGLCRTLKASYFKTGRINLQREDGMGATGVMIVYEN